MSVPVERLEAQISAVADGTRVLAVTGSLDLFTAPRFEQNLLAALDGTDTALIVDLTDCDFLDSGALAVIVRRNRLLDGEGPRLLFVAPQPSLLRVFALTRLDSVLEIHPTRAEALACVQALHAKAVTGRLLSTMNARTRIVPDQRVAVD